MPVSDNTEYDLTTVNAYQQYDEVVVYSKQQSLEAATHMICFGLISVATALYYCPKSLNINQRNTE